MNILLREGPGADRERRRQIELLLYWRERKKEEEDEEKEGEEREKQRLLGCAPIFLEKLAQKGISDNFSPKNQEKTKWNVRERGEQKERVQN